MQTWVLIRRELVERVIDRKFLLATMLTPLLLGFCLALPQYLSFSVLQRQQTYVVYDASGLDLARTLAATVGSLEVRARGHAVPFLRLADDGSFLGVPDAPRDSALVPRFVFVEANPAPDAPPAPPARRDQGNVLERYVLRTFVPPGVENILPIREAWDPSHDFVKDAVRRNRAAGYLVFPPHFVEDGTFHLYARRATDLEGFLVLKTAIDRLVRAHRLAARGLDPSLIEEIARATRADLRTPDRRRLRWSDLLGAMTAALLLYLTIMLFGNSVLHAVLEDRQTRVAEVLLASTSASRYLAGKVVGAGLAGFLQYAVWTALYVGIARAWPDLGAMELAFAPEMMGVIAAAFLLGFALYGPLLAIVGVMADSAQEAVQVAMPFIIVQSLPVLVLWGVLRDPSQPWAVFLTWLPLTAPFIAPGVHIVEPMGSGKLLALAATTAAGALVSLAIAARVFRHTLLHQGSTMTWGQLIARLRQRIHH